MEFLKTRKERRARSAGQLIRVITIKLFLIPHLQQQAALPRDLAKRERSAATTVDGDLILILILILILMGEMLGSKYLMFGVLSWKLLAGRGN